MRLQHATNAGKCPPANYRKAAKRRKPAGKQFYATPNALCRLRLAETGRQGRQHDAGSERLERGPDAVDETWLRRHRRQQAWPFSAEDFQLTKGDRMARADNHQMRRIQRSRGARRLLRERPRQSGRAAPERGGLAGVAFRNGVKVGVAFTIAYDNFV